MKNEPQYLNIYKRLRKQIEIGDYRCGEKLPSKRVTADKFGVSVITAEHAYALLEDEGYIRAKQRSGFFCVYDAASSFSVGESDGVKAKEVLYTDGTFPFSLFAKTMRKVISDYAERILVKSPNSGCIELRTAIAKYLSRSREIAVTPDRIIIGSGAEYLYGLIIQAIGRDKKYAVEMPSYEKIKKVYEANGIAVENLPLYAHGIDSAALFSSNADVLHVSPYRSFPSGVTATAAKKREYLDWAASGDRLLIEDDFESEFSTLSKPVDTLFSLTDKDNVIYLNTFSKTVAPAIRTGYIVLPEKLCGLFNEKIGFYSCTVPTFEQYVLAQFLDSGDFERHLNRVRRKKRRESKQ